MREEKRIKKYYCKTFVEDSYISAYVSSIQAKPDASYTATPTLQSSGQQDPRPSSNVPCHPHESHGSAFLTVGFTWIAQGTQMETRSQQRLVKHPRRALCTNAHVLSSTIDTRNERCSWVQRPAYSSLTHLLFDSLPLKSRHLTSHPRSCKDLCLSQTVPVGERDFIQDDRKSGPIGLPHGKNFALCTRGVRTTRNLYPALLTINFRRYNNLACVTPAL